MPIYYSGQKYTIEITEDGLSSRREAESCVPSNKKACIAQHIALIKRLADIGELKSPEQFRHEGEGVWAVKARCGLRAYGWYHGSRRGVFVISHFLLKKQQKLDRRDLDRAKRNREQYENSGDDND